MDTMKEDYKQQIIELKEKVKELDKLTKEMRLQGFEEEKLDEYIEKLHEYNETKDIAQFVLGRLAEMYGITIKEMHERYGLDPED